MNKPTNPYVDKILQLAIKEASEETKEFMKEFYLDSLDFACQHLIPKQKREKLQENNHG